MKFGVVVFPGSNCDDDTYHAIDAVLKQPVEYLWHQTEDLANCDAVILPGGFAYGDYLRTGAIARFSPVMSSVSKFAKSGGLVLGICNGFQVLCEAGLLPGAMLTNQGLRFLCQQVQVRVESTATPFTSAAHSGQVLTMPIAHMGGNYFCDDRTLHQLRDHDQIIFRYTSPDGRATSEDDRDANPNGSIDSIAGVCNHERNVLGLMPHPERAVEKNLGSVDGLVIFKSMLESFAASATQAPAKATARLREAVHA